MGENDDQGMLQISSQVSTGKIFSSVMVGLIKSFSMLMAAMTSDLILPRCFLQAKSIQFFNRMTTQVGFAWKRGEASLDQDAFGSHLKSLATHQLVG
jgi:hypothetical protein